ncbi:MAG: hypothetical protein HKN21_17360, partial [Candidatus Eisenbacteria bacterium]|nr:hypothetical protein [Candidatus Eisenbacteria bacterium]
MSAQTKVVWNRAAILAIAALSVFGILTGCAERNEADAGSRETRLTATSSFHNNPRVSPDGDTIAFTKREGGDFSIYFMDANAMDAASPEEPRLLPNFESNAIFARWHPAGDRFYVVTIPMGELKLVNMEGEVLEDVNATPLAYLMDISPDGTEGLYTKFNGDNRDCGAVDFETGELVYIAETPRWEVSANYGPGPDDVTVASLPDYGAKVSDIRVFNRKDGTMEILPLGAGRLSEPTWSNNRKYMIYTSFASGSRDLFLYDRENFRSIALTHGPEEDTSPSWSPNDEEIIFLRKNSFTQVFFYDIETGESRPLTEGDSRRSAPRLSDDGKWVAYVERPLDSPGSAAPKSRLVAISMETGDQRVLADNIEASNEGAYSFSEDGSQIAFAANDGKGNT